MSIPNNNNNATDSNSNSLLEKDIYNTVTEDIILEIIFDIHKAVKTKQLILSEGYNSKRGNVKEILII